MIVISNTSSKNCHIWAFSLKHGELPASAMGTLNRERRIVPRGKLGIPAGTSNDDL
jgi:hypothetical protein